MMEKLIPAGHVRAGMTMVFGNARFNYFVDDVSFDREGEVKIEHGDFTAADWYKVDEKVWVLL